MELEADKDFTQESQKKKQEQEEAQKLTPGSRSTSLESKREEEELRLEAKDALGQVIRHCTSERVALVLRLQKSKVSFLKSSY
ncbi:hypothetical protein Tco_0574476 [Tanacetum coccineum]